MSGGFFVIIRYAFRLQASKMKEMAPHFFENSYSNRISHYYFIICPKGITVSNPLALKYASGF